MVTCQDKGLIKVGPAEDAPLTAYTVQSCQKPVMNKIYSLLLAAKLTKLSGRLIVSTAKPSLHLLFLNFSLTLAIKGLIKMMDEKVWEGVPGSYIRQVLKIKKRTKMSKINILTGVNMLKYRCL